MIRERSCHLTYKSVKCVGGHGIQQERKRDFMKGKRPIRRIEKVETGGVRISGYFPWP